MITTKGTLAVLFALSLFSSAVQAKDYEFYDFEAGKLYAGGGLSYNSLSGYDEAVGAQGFLGWDFFRFRKLIVAGEAGAFYSGSFSHTVASDRSFSGPYVNAVAKYPLTDKLWAQGRVGGNAISGLSSDVVGAGLGYRVTSAVSLRAEAVRYGSLTSLLQLEVVFNF